MVKYTKDQIYQEFQPLANTLYFGYMDLLILDIHIDGLIHGFFTQSIETSSFLMGG